jgi:hypothetical protein
LPFKIVFGIDEGVLPAPMAILELINDEKIAIAVKAARWLRFTGDLQVVGMHPV